MRCDITMELKTPKRFEDMTLGEILERVRNRKRSLRGMALVLGAPCKHRVDPRPAFSSRSAADGARGARSNTWGKHSAHFSPIRRAGFLALVNKLNNPDAAPPSVFTAPDKEVHIQGVPRWAKKSGRKVRL